MTHRNLRIAWTVFCGIACVLLCVLWVRSYWCGDLVLMSSARGVISSHGAVRLRGFKLNSPIPRWLISFPGLQEEKPSDVYSIFGFSYSESPSSSPLEHIRVPYWSFVFLSAVAGAVPWVRWQFTTRTLLGAMTAVAVVLGSVVWLVR